MKWGRKKSAGISLPHLFPIQWLSKLKQISIKPKSQPTPKSKPKTKPKSSPYNSSIPVCFRSSRPSDSGFRSVSDLSFSPQIFDRKTGQNLTGFVEPEDHFWRFSFRRQTHEFSEDGESSEDEFEFPMPKYSGSVSGRSSIKIERDESDYRFSQSQKFGDMLSDIRKKPSDIFWKFERLAEEQGSEDPRRSKKIEKSKKSRRAAARILEKEVLTSREESGQEEGRSPKCSSQISKSDQTDESISLDSRKSSQKKEDEEVQKSTALLSRKPGGEIGEDNDRPLSDTSEQKSEKDKKIKNLKRRTAKIRPRPQDGVYSPKRVSRNETCKIRSLERAKKRKKKKRETEKCKSFEKFAVVTSSFDPQNDFRESMMEMIAENAIEKPEELKSLLFCYLSLNSEEYHSLIIKVFRQVWFDLNRASLQRQSMETIASNIIRV